MKRAFLPMILLLTACAHAKQAANADRKPDNVETISIKNTGGSAWFVERQLSGFIVGTVRFRVVPVTREASAHLRGLDRSKAHSCRLEDASFYGKYEGNQATEGAYFVIDMACSEN